MIQGFSETADLRIYLTKNPQKRFEALESIAVAPIERDTSTASESETLPPGKLPKRKLDIQKGSVRRSSSIPIFEHSFFRCESPLGSSLEGISAMPPVIAPR